MDSIPSVRPQRQTPPPASDPSVGPPQPTLGSHEALGFHEALESHDFSKPWDPMRPWGPMRRPWGPMRLRRPMIFRSPGIP